MPRLNSQQQSILRIVGLVLLVAIVAGVFVYSQVQPGWLKTAIQSSPPFGGGACYAESGCVENVSASACQGSTGSFFAVGVCESNISVLQRVHLINPDFQTAAVACLASLNLAAAQPPPLPATGVYQLLQGPLLTQIAVEAQGGIYQYVQCSYLVRIVDPFPTPLAVSPEPSPTDSTVLTLPSESEEPPLESLTPTAAPPGEPGTGLMNWWPFY